MSALVSVVTRTLGRPSLADVAACLRAQTYRPLEWIVVNASGGPLPPLADAGDATVRLVDPGRRLLRAPALAAGLNAVGGRYVLILDDDDLIRPGHIAALVALLDGRSDVRAVHSDAEAWDAENSIGSLYEFEFSRLLLCRRNLFPPHAVLFDAALVQRDGCRVDEALDYFEDWDLWLQIAAHTGFVRNPQATAVYRTHLSQSGVLGGAPREALPRMAADKARVVARCAGVRESLEADYERLLEKAFIAQSRGDLATAASHYIEALRLDPLDVDTLGRYAELAMLAGDLDLARRTLEYAVRLEPEEPTAHWNLAVVLEASGLRDAAAAARERALALDPTLDVRASGAGEGPAREAAT
jgi:tetratricopeptide (TPR) repeat protein